MLMQASWTDQNHPEHKHNAIKYFSRLFTILVSAQDIATSPGIIEAANILFWDFDKKSFKLGSRGKDKPGTIRRYARDIIPQVQMTYDLNSMHGKEIVDQLPSEFDRWL